MKSANSFFIILFCMFAPFAVTMAQPGRYAEPVFEKALVTKGIPFSQAEKEGDGNITTLYFDFYEPAGDTATLRPLVITVFGGAYVAGSRDFCDMEEYCTRLAKHGYLAATIDYRLMSVLSASAKNIIRQMFLAAQDVSSAIRYFKHYGNEYRIDTNNIFLLGNSAGSIAILHEMFMEESERPDETFAPPALNSLHSSGFAEYAKKSPKVAGAVAQWGGVLHTDIIDSVECAPLCLIHGTADKSVTFDSGYCYSESFSFLMPYMYGSHPISERLSDIGFHDYEFHPVQGEEHAFYLSSLYQLIDDKFDFCFNITRDFLLIHLDFSNSSSQENLNKISDNGKFHVSVFPNPTKGDINIDFKTLDFQSVEVKLFDSYGNLIETQHGSADGIHISLAGEAAGIYFLKIYSNGEFAAARKIVRY